MKIHKLTKEETYLIISPEISTCALPFFYDVLSYFVNIHIEQPYEVIDHVIIDVTQYNDIQLLRDTLSGLQKPILESNKIVYIKRKGIRYILNDDICINVLNALYKDKYTIVVAYLEDMSFREQIDLMHGCILLVGCHGAGFINTYFMKPGAILFELFPESFYINCFENICKKKSITHYYMNGESSRSPPLTLEEYLKNNNHPPYNTQRFRASIRDITFSIDIDTFTRKLHEILPI
jgi:hypothetical protein